MTHRDSPWRPELPHNQLPALPPARELESRAVLKACIEARAALAELKQAAEQVVTSAKSESRGGSGAGSKALGSALAAFQFLAPLAAKAFLPMGW